MVIEQRYIHRLIQHDERAFEYIYHKTKKGVYGVAYAICRDHMIAEDLMQDAYMKMMQNLDKYQQQTNFYNWLITMTKNLALDHYRKKKKIDYVDQHDLDYMQSSNQHDIELNSEVHQMLLILTDEERMIVNLKVVDHMKHKDIAKLLDKPTGTIQSTYHQAMKKLKEYQKNR